MSNEYGPNIFERMQQSRQARGLEPQLEPATDPLRHIDWAARDRSPWEQVIHDEYSARVRRGLENIDYSQTAFEQHRREAAMAARRAAAAAAHTADAIIRGPRPNTIVADDIIPSLDMGINLGSQVRTVLTVKNLETELPEVGDFCLVQTDDGPLTLIYSPETFVHWGVKNWAVIPKEFI
ncbi:MAG: hypothetical protein ACRBBW_16270 [Cellvibrionaceae bacterium]